MYTPVMQHALLSQGLFVSSICIKQLSTAGCRRSDGEARAAGRSDEGRTEASQGASNVFDGGSDALEDSNAPMVWESFADVARDCGSDGCVFDLDLGGKGSR